VTPEWRRRWARWRDRLRDRPLAEFSYRVAVAVIGLLVVAAGIVAIPYPGPGWAVLFIGLAILATEFESARRLLAYTRRRYNAVMAWFRRQGLWLQALGVAFTTAIVLVTLWFVGGLGWFAALVGVERAWLKSPIGLGG
jgi:uncharacterized protein (TIGR02611 family)